MKRRDALLPVLLATVVLHASSQAADSWKAIEKVPGVVSVPVLVDRTEREYFRVTPMTPLSLSVRGPAHLRIVSRAEMPPDASPSSAYALKAKDGKKVIERQQTTTTASADARLKKGTSRLGQSRQLIVRIPEGTHRLTLSVEGSSAVLLRLLVRQRAPVPVKTVSLTPVEATRTVSFTEDEKVIPYYTALPGRPVRFRIVGPVTLDLVSRLDFDATMRGSQPYTLAVSVGDGRSQRARLNTTKALTATYRELKDRVPGKFRRTEVSVPEGTHLVTVGLLKPAAGSVEIQARIPQPEVGAQE